MAETTTPGGVRIDHEEVGSGDPVVLVHGITESRWAWGPVVDRLAVAHRVVLVDLPGHGASGPAPAYGLADLAAGVAAVLADLAIERPRAVGHSLGGTVVAALATAVPLRSAVDVDQSLKLDDFQALVQGAAPVLRDRDAFPGFIAAMFDGMAGPLAQAEKDRLTALRRPDQDVVLGVWGVLLDDPPDDVAAQVDALLAGITCPFLSLHGSDPGPGYADWLTARVPTATVEVWDDHGHYPHLVDPERFVTCLEAFWALD